MTPDTRSRKESKAEVVMEIEPLANAQNICRCMIRVRLFGRHVQQLKTVLEGRGCAILISMFAWDRFPPGVQRGD
jgi:hypothetical protein